MDPRETLSAFDQFLADRALHFDAVVIGGAALNLVGVVSRPTKDCDILYPQLPAAIAEAARAFAAELRGRGQVLADDWLNNGPASLADQLPSRWQRRLQTEQQDINPDWPAHVRATVDDLGRRLGHGV